MEGRGNRMDIGDRGSSSNSRSPHEEQFRGHRGRHHEASSLSRNPFSGDTTRISGNGGGNRRRYDDNGGGNHRGRYDGNESGSHRGHYDGSGGSRSRYEGNGSKYSDDLDRHGYGEPRKGNGGDIHSVTTGNDGQTQYGSNGRSHGKRPHDDAVAGSSKQPRTDGQSSSGAGNNGKGSNEERRKRPDRYEIINTIPETYSTKKGTTGQYIDLYANFFKFVKRPHWELVQFRVDFNPECDLLPKRKYLMYTQRAMLGGYLYDTKNSIYLTRRLSQDTTVVTAKDREGNDVQMTFKFTNIVAMDTRESLQVLNLILRRAMDGLNLQLVGRNLFDAAARIDIHNFNLQLWPGYTTSIRQHQSDVMLCVEIAHKVMRNETIYDILVQCGSGRDFKDNFSAQVLGMVVLTDYNNKTYCVNDVDYDASPADTFETKTGPISFVEYYKRKYNITIRNPSQPMLIHRSKDKAIRGGAEHLISLVPELCRPTGLSERQRSNFQLMKSLSEYTRMDPRMRMRRLSEFNDRLNNTQPSIDMLRAWHFELDRNLVQVPGRVFKNENIVYGNSLKEPTSQRAADWQFRDKSMYLSFPLERWAVLVPHRMSQQANAFIDCLNKVARGMRYSLKRPDFISLNDDRNPTYLTKFQDAMRNDPQLVMAFVPNNNADRYANIKKMGCMDLGIPTQVMVQKTLNNNKGLMSIATKVLIQMNCKLGGVPWLVEIPTKGLMTVGIDVSRDKMDKKVVWCGLVATMDLKNVRKESFYSTVSKHTSSELYSTDLAMGMVKALRCYKEMNGALPDKICIYRDGVGEGQTTYVYQTEVNEMKQKLEEMYSKPGIEQKLKFAFIIVSKKINTRIFTRNDNPPPGTIVDDIITLPERYDFYLVSQSVRQGTVSPTSYNVLYDTMGFPADRLQQLTYKQTHLYYNWTGTVRVPAVCQYAHKLTFLIAQSIHGPPSSALDKKLYFL